MKGSIKGIVMLGLLTMGLELDAAPKPGEGPRNSGDPINSLPTRNAYSTEVRARGPAIDNQSAARRVKERFRDRRILGINGSSAATKHFIRLRPCRQRAWWRL